MAQNGSHTPPMSRPHKMRDQWQAMRRLDPAVVLLQPFAMAVRELRFLFDFISPYAYLAWTQIHALAERHGREVVPVPVLFAALLNEYGHKGPAEIPPKRVYIFKDVLRTAHRLRVPLSPPPSHPFRPLLALRAASLPLSPGERRTLIDALFRAAWGGGPGVESPAEVARAAREAGLLGEAIVAEAGSEASKARLRAQTEQAVADGAFGVPTMIADGELFWGLDSFGHLEGFLRGEDPIDPKKLASFSGTPASASRVR